MLRAWWSTVAPWRREWGGELLAAALVAISLLAVFNGTGADRAIAAWLYQPGLAEPWPGSAAQPWRALFRWGPLAAAAPALLALGALILARWRPALRAWRPHALCALLVLALGPGVLVNAVLKDHTGRPRPRDVQEFGGRWEFQAPLVLGESGRGRSFPSGHAAAGFALLIGWPLWRRRRPVLAWTSLGLGLAAGGLLGWTRLLQGGHWLSDVLWAGWLVWVLAVALAHFAFRLPAREDGRLAGAGPPWLLWTAAGALLAPILWLLAAAYPVYREFELRPEAGWRPAELLVEAPAGDLRVELVPGAEPLLAGTVRSYGLPTNQLDVQARDGLAGWRIRGWCSEVDGDLRLRLDPRGLARLTLACPRGRMVVVAPADLAPRPAIAVRTLDGHVTLPAGWTLAAGPQ